jgi:hypothetical protein
LRVVRPEAPLHCHHPALPGTALAVHGRPVPVLSLVLKVWSRSHPDLGSVAWRLDDCSPYPPVQSLLCGRVRPRAAASFNTPPWSLRGRTMRCFVPRPMIPAAPAPRASH